MEYYDKMSEQIILTATQQANMGKYDEAIYMLLEIPNICSSYSKAIEVATSIYQKKIDEEAATLYMQAQSLWNSTHNFDGAQQVSVILSQINPLSSYMSKAVSLSETIAKRIGEIDQREWDFKLKQEQNQVDLQKAKIQAIAEVAKAEANRSGYSYNVVWW